MIINCGLSQVISFNMKPKTNFLERKFIIISSSKGLPIFVLAPDKKVIPMGKYIAEYFIYGDQEIIYVVRNLLKINYNKALFELRALAESSPMFEDFMENRFRDFLYFLDSIASEPLRLKVEDFSEELV